jgi:hypothetical protein
VPSSENVIWAPVGGVNDSKPSVAERVAVIVTISPVVEGFAELTNAIDVA